MRADEEDKQGVITRQRKLFASQFLQEHVPMQDWQSPKWSESQTASHNRTLQQK